MLLALAVLVQAGALPQGGAVRVIAITQCIFMREQQATAAAFIAGVGPLRRRLAADPRLAGVTVDDASGTGCRVSFTGTPADADLVGDRAKMAPNQLLFSRMPLPSGRVRTSTTLIYPRSNDAAVADIRRKCVSGELTSPLLCGNSK